jgi:hypothetical protein
MRDRDRTPANRPPPESAFPDWDNPEDQDEDWEDAPEGYYDEDDDDDDEDDDGYIPGPDDPDYDLSEAAGYAGWEEPGRRALVPQWLIVVFSIVLILAILIPLFFRP